QEILHAVSRSVGQLEYDPALGEFRNWLFTIVRRKLSTWRLKQSRQERGSGDSDVHQLIEQCAEDSGAESDWDAAWQQRMFTWACAEVRPSVSESTWQAFWRTAVSNQSGKLVADELGISVAAVYLARRRVLARLQESIRLAQEP